MFPFFLAIIGIFLSYNIQLMEHCVSLFSCYIGTEFSFISWLLLRHLEGFHQASNNPLKRLCWQEGKCLAVVGVCNLPAILLKFQSTPHKQTYIICFTNWQRKILLRQSRLSFVFFSFWGGGGGWNLPLQNLVFFSSVPFFLASFNILHCCIISLYFSCFQPF